MLLRSYAQLAAHRPSRHTRVLESPPDHRKQVARPREQHLVLRLQHSIQLSFGLGTLACQVIQLAPRHQVPRRLVQRPRQTVPPPVHRRKHRQLPLRQSPRFALHPLINLVKRPGRHQLLLVHRERNPPRLLPHPREHVPTHLRQRLPQHVVAIQEKVGIRTRVMNRLRMQRPDPPVGQLPPLVRLEAAQPLQQVPQPVRLVLQRLGRHARIKQIAHIDPEVPLEPPDIAVRPVEHLDNLPVGKHRPKTPPHVLPQLQHVHKHVLLPRRQLHQTTESLETPIVVRLEVHRQLSHRPVAQRRRQGLQLLHRIHEQQRRVLHRRRRRWHGRIVDCIVEFNRPDRLCQRMRKRPRPNPSLAFLAPFAFALDRPRPRHRLARRTPRRQRRRVHHTHQPIPPRHTPHVGIINLVLKSALRLDLTLRLHDRHKPVRQIRILFGLAQATHPAHPANPLHVPEHDRHALLHQRRLLPRTLPGRRLGLGLCHIHLITHLHIHLPLQHVNHPQRILHDRLHVQTPCPRSLPQAFPERPQPRRQGPLCRRLPVVADARHFHLLEQGQRSSLYRPHPRGIRRLDRMKLEGGDSERE